MWDIGIFFGSPLDVVCCHSGWTCFAGSHSFVASIIKSRYCIFRTLNAVAWSRAQWPWPRHFVLFVFARLFLSWYIIAYYTKGKNANWLSCHFTGAIYRNSKCSWNNGTHTTNVLTYYGQWQHERQRGLWFASRFWNILLLWLWQKYLYSSCVLSTIFQVVPFCWCANFQSLFQLVWEKSQGFSR